MLNCDRSLYVCFSAIILNSELSIKSDTKPIYVVKVDKKGRKMNFKGWLRHFNIFLCCKNSRTELEQKTL